MLGVQLGVTVLALRRAASRGDLLVIARCCPRALRSSDYIEHFGVRNLAPSMLAIVLAAISRYALALAWTTIA